MLLVKYFTFEVAVVNKNSVGVVENLKFEVVEPELDKAVGIGGSAVFYYISPNVV